MKSKWIEIFFLFGIIFFADCRAVQEEMMVIDSALADYDGKKITLSGNVVVEHELGKISANQVVLFPENEEKKVRFAYLKMNDNVKISLKDGGQLNCSIADLDYKSMTGKFSGNPQQEYVIYTESCKDKAGISVPLVVKSRQMNVQITREESQNSQTPKSLLNEITAESNVTVNYNHDFIITSDQAQYQRLQKEKENNTSSQPRLPGLIQFRAAEQAGFCQVTNRNGDMIRANQIYIDTLKRHLLFLYPKGIIFSPSHGDQKEEPTRTEFSSDTMTWEEPKDLLILRDHVVVNQKGIGQIANNEEVQIHRHVVGGKKLLRSIDSSGETIMTLLDEAKGIMHTLTCYGKVILDNEHLITHLESPRDAYGKVLPGKQVFFEDRLGEVYADKADLLYEYANKSIVPAKLILTGNVWILNRSTAHEEDPGKFLQYSIAETVEFYPQTKEMHFFSKENGRVLFFDKANNVQMSAPALKIKRDPNSKADSIHGVGDVRFSFLENELEQLRKRFGFKEEKEEKKDNQEVSLQEGKKEDEQGEP